MVGLDNAGKSTILYHLHLGEVVETSPTIGSNVEEVVHKRLKFQCWDLGGQERMRKVWAAYYAESDVIVLVLDSTDRERLSLVRTELAAICSNEVLNRAALLILANKQDLPGALSAEEITRELKLHINKERAWTIQPCSALEGTGLTEGMDWVVRTLRPGG
jgi:small GTP-binding protein